MEWQVSFWRRALLLAHDPAERSTPATIWQAATLSLHTRTPIRSATFSVRPQSGPRYFGMTTADSLGRASSVALSIPRWSSTSSGGVCVSHSESAKS